MSSLINKIKNTSVKHSNLHGQRPTERRCRKHYLKRISKRLHSSNKKNAIDTVYTTETHVPHPTGTLQVQQVWAGGIVQSTLTVESGVCVPPGQPELKLTLSLLKTHCMSSECFVVIKPITC